MRPKKNYKLYATGVCPFHKKGEYIGKVIKCDKDIVFFMNVHKETDQFIWRFKDKTLNKYFYWKPKKKKAKT